MNIEIAKIDENGNFTNWFHFINGLHGAGISRDEVDFILKTTNLKLSEEAYSEVIICRGLPDTSNLREHLNIAKKMEQEKGKRKFTKKLVFLREKQ